MTVLTLADPTLVKEMEEIAAKRQTAPDLLLRQVVRQFLDQSPQQRQSSPQKLTNAERPLPSPAWLREQAAFERLKPELLQHYRGRVVAIHGEQVVAVGDNVLDVHEVAIKQVGAVPCYVDFVTEEPARPKRIPSIWKAS